MSASLPPNDNPSFAPDYASAICYPAHPTNYARGAPLAASMGGFCLHTAEEDADDIEVTPRWFAQDHGDPARAGSTTYYVDSDGDVYQCVSEDWMHFGNGVKGKPWPAWADPNINLNWQTISIEIEGRAANIEETLIIGGPQWLSLVALIRDRAGFYRIPLDREHVIGHYEVSNERSDPGVGFPWDALMRDLNAAGEPEQPFVTRIVRRLQSFEVEFSDGSSWEPLVILGEPEAIEDGFAFAIQPPPGRE